MMKGRIATYAPVNKDVDPDLPVLESTPNILPPKLIRLRNSRVSTLLLARSLSLTLILESKDDKGALLLGQELCGFGEIVEGEKGPAGDEDGDDALEDKDPTPAFEAADAVHLGDRKGEETAEGAGDGGG